MLRNLRFKKSVVFLLPILLLALGIFAPATSWAAQEATTAAAQKPAKLFIRLIKQKDYDRVVFEWDDEVGYEISEDDDGGVMILFNRPAVLEQKHFKKNLPPSLSSFDILETDEGLGVMIRRTKPFAALRPFKRDHKVMIDFMSPDNVAPTAAPAAPPKAAELTAAAGPDFNSASKDRVNGNESITLSQDTAPGLAVFKKDGYIWLVSDQAFDADKLVMKDPKNKLLWQRVSGKTGAAFRLPVNENLNPSVKIVGPNWLITLSPDKVKPNKILNLEAKEENVLLLKEKQAKDPLVVTDPDSNQVMNIIPLSSVGKGVDAQKDFVFFTVWPSPQGMVILSKGDPIDVSLKDEGIQISRAKGDLDLQLQSIDPFKGIDDGSKEKVFNLLQWQSFGKSGTKKFSEQEMNAQMMVIHAQDLARDKARLDFAKMLFAYGYWDKAMGILAYAEQQNNKIADTLVFKAVRGASLYLVGNLKEAENIFTELTGKSNDPEIFLWLGATQAEQGNWPAALDSFKKSNSLPFYYPISYQERLVTLIAKAYSQGQDFKSGVIFIDELLKQKSPVKDRFLFFKADMLIQDNKLPDGIKILKKIKNSPDRWVKAETNFALTNALLADNQIDKPEAIKQMEKNRTLWRGDQFEFDMLVRLGELYEESGDYRNTLDTYKNIVLGFPDNPKSADITKKMVDLYKKLFLGGQADAMKPLEALALFNDFRELIPLDQEGDKIVQNMAERLVAVDLLDRAAVLLEHQIKYRVQGPERAKLGLRLADIYLMDHKPDQALDAIKFSNALDVNDDMKTQRMRLRARAYLDQGKYDFALETLEKDKSKESEILQLQAYWKTQNWPKVVMKIEQMLVGQQPPYNADTQQLIINLTVAMVLAGDEDRVREIKAKYQDGMATTDSAADFNALTDPGVENREINSIIPHYKSVETFQTFLETMRQQQAKEEAARAAASAPPPPPAPEPAAAPEAKKDDKKADADKAKSPEKKDEKKDDKKSEKKK